MNGHQDCESNKGFIFLCSTCWFLRRKLLVWYVGGLELVIEHLTPDPLNLESFEILLDPLGA